MTSHHADPNESVLRPYLRDVAGTLPDPDRGLADVLGRIPATPQAGRRWPVRHPNAGPSTPTHGRFQSMFNATRIVVAGAVVALSGGLLYGSLLTRPEDTSNVIVAASSSADVDPRTPEVTTAAEDIDPVLSTRSDLLPGVDLSTEAVEPGVFRVIEDGVRELAYLREGGDEGSLTLAAGPDGSMWRVGSAFERLGAATTHDGDPHPRQGRPHIGPDGTLWVTGRRDEGLYSYDGSRWRKRLDGEVQGVRIGADGSVWISRNLEGRRWGGARELLHLDGDRWVRRPGPPLPPNARPRNRASTTGASPTTGPCGPGG